MRSKVPKCYKTILYNMSFTLIELMSVIVILMILMALLLPALQLARQQSQKVQCIANFKQIGLGYMAYTEDHDGLMVPILSGGKEKLGGSRWAAQGTQASKHYADHLIDTQYSVSDLWKCPGHRNRLPPLPDGSIYPDYAMSPFFYDGGKWGSNVPPWQLAVNPKSTAPDWNNSGLPYPLRMIDIIEKGLLLADGWVAQNYIFLWHQTSYPPLPYFPGRHFRQQNVLFFDLHVESLAVMDFCVMGNGAWGIPASATQAHITFVAWIPILSIARKASIQYGY